METKEIQIIEKKSNDVVQKANSLTISSQSDYDSCADFLRAIKGLKKEIDTTFDDSIKKAHEAHKSIVAAKKSHYVPLDDAERIIKQKSISWYKEEQRKQQEEQRKIDEAVRKAEEKRKAELEAQAKKHEANGNLDKADERRAMAEEVFIPVPIVESKAIKAEGQAIVVTWVADESSIDLFSLCNAIARGELPETCVKVNMTQLNSLARTWKDKKKFSGVTFIKQERMSIRG